MNEIAPLPLIRVNGQDEPLSAPTVASFLAERSIFPEAPGIAVALNGRVVPRAAWPDTTLSAHDVIEIVVAKQGG
jgi:sulfur carrier protein